MRHAMLVDPISPDDQQPHRLRGPGERGHSRRRRREDAREIHDHHEADQAPQPDRADAIARRRFAKVEQQADREDGELGGQGAGQRVPEPEAQALRAVQRERHVGQMGDVVQQPVTDDEQRDGDGGGDARSPDREMDRAEGDSPQAQREQAVRVRIADEDERRHGRRAGLNLHAFVAEQEERRPEEIRELAGSEQCAERHHRRGFLRAEGEAEMTHEHQCPPA